jgi:hypothetical protein
MGIFIELLIKMELAIKLSAAKRKGWVGSVATEIAFMQEKNFPSLNMKILEANGIKYLPDLKRIGSRKVQWDNQYDSVEVFKRKGGDCNSLNRVIQVYWNTQGMNAYLITYVAKDFKLNHTTCVVKTLEGYIPMDYGYRGPACKSLKLAIDVIAAKYKTSIVDYAIQDINWNFVSQKKV